ncbi:MAG: hypothetical protein AAF975_05485, partial [Spirochaetota bacterium]
MKPQKQKRFPTAALPFQRFSLALLVLWFVGSANLFAQAPTDEWRRGGLDAMVAEPGQASSILSNPA